MDKSIVTVDESQWRGDFVASAATHSGFVIGIKSISIDLDCALKEIGSPMHEHFSIRGYVADMRKKDPKMCLPFGLEGDDLPPLDIPKFRWWEWSDCTPQVCAELTSPKLKLLTGNHGEHGSKEIANGEENNNNQIVLYNPPCNGEETYGDESAENVSSEYMGHAFDVAENVSSEFDELSLAEWNSDGQTHIAGIPDLNEPLSFNCQTLCIYRGIPDLNEPYTEIPSNTQGNEYRSSALLRFSDACEQLARESKRQNIPGPSNRGFQSSRGNATLEFCTINQNPADFTYISA